MPNNPSELARLEAELEDLKKQAFDIRLSKSTREELLVQLRKLEYLLGKDSRSYNGE